MCDGVSEQLCELILTGLRSSDPERSVSKQQIALNGMWLVIQKAVELADHEGMFSHTFNMISSHKRNHISKSQLTRNVNRTLTNVLARFSSKPSSSNVH